MTFKPFQSFGCVEILESRIAPASVISPVGNVGKNIVSAVANTPTKLFAGETLSTSSGHDSSGNGNGTYLLYVESGSCLVFNTDLNKNGQVDFNEITGIAAGNGLELISFVDIHGDIVTNLTSGMTLSDSDGNASNNNPLLGGDGQVLLRSTIDLIDMRSLVTSDLYGTQTISQMDKHLAPSSYSIYGSIYAGAGFGTSDGLNGLIIDTSGAAEQASVFVNGSSYHSYQATTPIIGDIRTGTAASGESFSFGVSDLSVNSNTAQNVSGTLVTFTPATGQVGGDIYGVHSTSTGVIGDANSVAFNLGGLYAGNGGFGARGGNIADVVIGGDTAGGYTIKAGNGGDGFNGGDGGSIFSFEDLGSNTTKVVIQSGTGGVGLTGSGGNGGHISLGTMNIFGDVLIKMGDGGNGFKAGGQGASLKTLTFTSPSPTTVSGGLQVVATWRDPYTTTNGANLGRVLPVDFNGDGTGDYAYIAQNPGEVIVELSDGSGGFTRVNLDVAGTPSQISVGDFNGDGHPDIAVGLSSGDSTAGSVEVYLGKWKNGGFDGMSSGKLNPLPVLFNTPDPAFTGDSFEITGTPITQLVTGDFNQDGITDIAVTATFTTINTGVLYDVLLVLQGDGHGHFFANFGADAASGLNYDPVYVVGLHANGTVELQAAGLGAADSDVLLVGVTGQKFFQVLDFSQGEFITDATATVLHPATVFTESLGQVDTNRQLPAGNSPNITLTNATFGGFTVGDLNGDSFGDIAVLTKAPAGYLVIYQGDGTAGGFTIASGTGQQAGIHLVANDGTHAPLSDTEFNPTGLAITSGDTAGSVLAIYGTETLAGLTHAVVYTISVQADTYGGTITTPTMNGGTQVGSINDLGATANANGNVFAVFDTYRSDATGAGVGTVGFITLLDALPTGTRTDGSSGPAVSGILDSTVGTDVILDDLTPNASLTLTAGNGGNSTIGTGGAGGSFGGDTLGAISVDGSAFATSVNSGTGKNFSGFLFTAGVGGSGFLAGGNGGAITGVKITYDTSVSTVDYLPAILVAGDGGDSIRAKGGDGGSFSNNIIFGGDIVAVNGVISGGVTLIAGDGGSGRIGGAGGSVTGNHNLSNPDSKSYGLTLVAGAGGNGIVAGGAGGTISSYLPQMLLAVGSLLQYTAGAGGDAAAGLGGNGGSILNSSPSSIYNGFGGFITLHAGDGGNGLTGGMGGSITSFINNPTQTTLPEIFTVVAGNGGSGISGNGGAGGSISKAQSVGIAYNTSTSSSEADVLLAGNGGESYGGVGGIGGNIIAAEVSAVGGGIILGAGAGGNGLIEGGAGGNVLNSTANASTAVASSSKVLVAAGAGGDAYASTAAKLVSEGFYTNASIAAMAAFGNANGVGGNGGSITNFTQGGSVTTSVDLIAGNGGSTINYGTSDPSEKQHVGTGGSITNVTLAGTVGNTDSTTPIQAYGVTASTPYGSTATYFSTVHDTAVNYAADPYGFSAPTISDSDGNVGLVVGAAGRVKGDQPVSLGINGSVTNLTARAIMSMVAGSVDRLASIQSATNIHVSLTAPIGTDKAPTGLQYIDTDGVSIINAPVLGGELIDGAIIVKSPIQNTDGSNVPTGLIYVLS